MISHFCPACTPLMAGAWQRRSTLPFNTEEPIGLTQAYANDPARTLQWRAFVRRRRFEEEAVDLARLIDEIRPFVLPVLSKIAADAPFKACWKPGGPWE